MRDEDWQAGARAHRVGLPLPLGVACYAVAASKQERSAKGGSRVRGDGLVPVASALGQHEDAARDLGLPEDHCHISYGTGHFGLLSNAKVYARMRGWLSEPMPSECPPRAAGSRSRAGR